MNMKIATVALVILVIGGAYVFTTGFTSRKPPTTPSSSSPVIADSDAPGYKTYTDQGGTFTFAFRSDFSVSTKAETGTAWTAPASTAGIVLAKILVPASFEPGTNFGDATFTVGASTDPSAVATCLQSLAGGTGSAVLSIGGTQFTKLEFQGAAAGNRYDTTSYRAVRNGQCYAVEYTIHYSVFENYPKGAVKEFDEAKATMALDEIAKSFQFLKP